MVKNNSGACFCIVIVAVAALWFISPCLANSMIEVAQNRTPQVTYILAPHHILIEDGGAAVYINYVEGTLHRFHPKKAICTSHSILRADVEPFISAKIESFAKITLLNKNNLTDPPVCPQTKAVFFGQQALITRRLTTPAMKQLGMEFVPQRVDITIDSQHPDLEEIKKIVISNEARVEMSPLIHQIDLTHLIFLLGGLPVKLKKHGQVTNITYQVSTVPGIRDRVKQNYPCIEKVIYSPPKQ